MRVLVLTTGRAGSTTFAHAAEHIEGMTAGHETRVRMLQDRLDYPDGHIEVDNRLAWFLGSIDARFNDRDTFYVHLRRDSKRVASSYLDRWHIRVSVVRAFYQGILMNREKPTPEQALDACRLFVDTVEDNIRYFLKDRSNWAEVRLEHMEADFFTFMEKAGLQGNDAAIREVLQSHHNVSKRAGKKSLRNLYARFSSRKLPTR